VNLKVAGALLCLAAALAALVPLFTHGAASDDEISALQRALWKKAQADSTFADEVAFTRSFQKDYFTTTLIWSAALIVLGLATAYVANRKSAKAALAVAAPATGAAVVKLLTIPGADHPMLGFDRMLAIVSLAAMALGGILLVVATAKARVADD
jgi:hypothetical protein